MSVRQEGILWPPAPRGRGERPAHLASQPEPQLVGQRHRGALPATDSQPTESR